MPATDDIAGREDLARQLMHELLRDSTRLVAQARGLSIPRAGRGWIRLADSEHADAWLIGWSPSSSVGTHDHGGSRGIVHVLRGALVERYWPDGEHGPEHMRRLARGQTVSVPPGRVHDVANNGRRQAWSLHVYSPRLTTMSFYPELVNGETDDAFVLG